MTTTARLDHVVVNARDRLEAAAQAYAALGFSLTPPSRHTLGSMNRLALFAEHYLELIGIDPDAQRPREELLRAPEGLNAIVFAADDAASLYESLSARGVPVELPMDFSRPVAGLGEARFRTIHITPAAVPYGRLYFCQHFTRGIVWGAGATAHPNGASAITKITVETRDPDAAAALFRAMFGAGAVDADFVLHLGAVRVELTRAAHDRIASITFRARGPRRSVAPDAAFGAALEFSGG